MPLCRVNLGKSLYMWGILVVVLIVVFQQWPWAVVQLTPDSEAYFRAAQSLASNGSFGETFTHWPPLYPMLLAFLSVLLGDMMLAAFMLNAICFLLLAVVVFELLITCTHSAVLTSLCGTLILLSPPLSLVFQFAWSEPMFLVVSLIALRAFVEYLYGHDNKWLYFSAACLGLSCLTRHIGVTLWLGVGLFWWLDNRVRRGRLIEWIVVFVLGMLPYGLWVMRTWLLTATATGERQFHAPGSIWEEYVALSKVVAHWFFPHSYFNGNEGYALGIATMAFTVTAWQSLVVLRCLSPARVSDALPKGTILRGVLATFVVVYSLFLVLISSILSMDSINQRLASPVITPLFVVVASLFYQRVMTSSGPLGVLCWRVGSYGLGIWWLIWMSAPNPFNQWLLSY